MVFDNIIKFLKRKRPEDQSTESCKPKKKRSSRKILCPPFLSQVPEESMTPPPDGDDESISSVVLREGNGSANASLVGSQTISTRVIDLDSKEKYRKQVSLRDLTVLENRENGAGNGGKETQWEKPELTFVQKETKKLIERVNAEKSETAYTFYSANQELSDWTNGIINQYGYARRSGITRCAGDTRDAEFTEALEEQHESSICEAMQDPLDLLKRCDISLKVTAPPVTDKMKHAVHHALTRHQPTHPVAELGRHQCTPEDLRKLNGLNWLNDEVINYYLQLIQQRALDDTNLPSVYSFNTFLFPRLQDQGHAGVKRWTRKVNIFNFDILLVPIHLGVHWCMVIVDMRKKVVRYLDSMGGSNPQCRRVILEYLKKEHIAKFDQSLPSDWTTESCSAFIPQQLNSSDCGVFALKFADYLSRDLSIGFEQSQMPTFRKLMQYEILHNSLLC